MSWHALILVLTIHAAALVSPGPDFAVITRLSIVFGRRTGLWAAAGVATAIGVYVLVCVLGLTIVIAAMPELSRILAVAGALYLAWLGIQCLRSHGKLPDAGSPGPAGKSFVTGFLTNILNPKAMFYLGAILSQAVTPHLGLADTVLLCCLLVAESLLWFFLFAVLRSEGHTSELQYLMRTSYA